MGRRSNDIGKAFENDVEDVLKGLAKRRPLRYHRFHDSHAAGLYLPATPCDYLVGTKRGGIMIECKASEKHESLTQCLSMVSDPQAAEARLWTRAGNPYLFVFYSFITDVVEVWEGKQVGECRGQRTKLPKRAMIDYSSKYALETLLTSALL